MKKNRLKLIIKEEIKSILNEKNLKHRKDLIIKAKKSLRKIDKLMIDRKYEI